MPLSGEPVRASDRDTQYLASLRAAAVQSIPDNSPTPLNFDTEDIDDDNGHSVASNTSKYFVQRDGRFEVGGIGSHGASTGGTSRNLSVLLNGVAVTGATVASGPRTVGTGAFQQNLTGCLVEAVTGDYIELALTQNSGGSLNTGANSLMIIRYWGND